MRRSFLWALMLCILAAFGDTVALAAAEPKQAYVVAVIDTGVDYTHPELAPHMWMNNTTLPGKHGYDFINGDDDPMDDFGHGTHCAGIILQECRRLGVPGRVEIMALKNMNESGSGLYENAVAAYRYIIDAKKQGVNVVAVSNSWGITENPAELEDIIREAGEMGIVSLCAAGNSAEDLDRYKTFPAGYDSPYTVIVAAANDDNELASFSCYGKHDVDVAAPGVNVLSTYHKEAYLPEADLEKDIDWTLQPDDQTYEEGNAAKEYANVREYAFDAPLSTDCFVGIEYTMQADRDFFGICHVEVYQDGFWWRTGAFGLDNVNFHVTKCFELPAGVERMRLICTSIDMETTLRICKLSCGASSGRFFKLSGTSQATPKVAAEAMWLQIQYPTASTDEIIARIIGGVDKCLPQGLIASDGVINPQKALNDPSPVIVSARAEDKHVTLDGWFFGADEGTVTSTQPYRVLRWSDREIVVQTDIAPENTEDFTVTRADGVASVQRLRFECKSQAWESHAPLPEPLAWSEAVTCGEYIYVIGGTRSDESTSNQLYRYDPASDSWTDCGSITEDAEADYLQYGLSAVCLKDKIVLASYDGLKNENRFFAYHPEDGQWSELQFSSLPPVTCNAALAVYRDALYLVGGIVKDEPHEDENSIWRLDEAENAWMKAGQLSGERFDPLAVQVGDALYILGGKQGENVPVNTWEIFDGASTALMGEFPLSGIDKTNAVYAGRKTLFVYTDGNTFSSAGISFDTQSECWSELHEQLGFAERTEICGAALEDKLYFIGGLSDLRMTDQVDAIQISQ